MAKLSMNFSTRRRSPFLALQSDFEWLPIGTRVHYTHRAAVARYKQLWESDKVATPDSLRIDFGADPTPPIGWKLIDGLLNGEQDPQSDLFAWEPLRFKFAKYPQAKDSQGVAYTKTIMVWPEDSFGWIIGRVRKGIGKSHKSAYYSGGYYDPPEYDQGYLAVDMYVDLYVIKLYYQGVDYIYCPMWAVSKAEEE